MLLLGEFSGLYKNLSDGLREIGMDVTWASNGDGWKKIGGADLEIFPAGDKLRSKIYNYVIFPLVDKRFQNFDIVQTVTPMIYPWWINEMAMNRIRKYNHRMFINAAGSDCFQYKAYLAGKYKYFIYDNNPELIKEFDQKSIRSKAQTHSTENLYKKADGIIPVVPFDYEVPFEKMRNVRRTILLPINWKEIQYSTNNVSGKIVFFHGINRPTDKGTSYIADAMKIIQNKYPKQVKCIIAERMPYDKYLRIISEANVIIDQCKGYGYGVNACVSLAKGKLVMGGAEPDFMRAGNLYDCPIYNIIPNVNQIVEQMERIIASKTQIPEIGKMGREYIVKHHDYINIAKQYVEEWNK